MKKGSITVFCALCMMLVTSFLLVLLESGRMYGLDAYAKFKAEAGVDSVCAEFQPLLWEEYGLLALDGAYGTEYFSLDYVIESLAEYVKKSSKNEQGISAYEELDLFQLSLSDAKVEGYALLTDSDGDVFLDYVAERMKEDLSVEVAEDILEDYQEYQKLEAGQDNMARSVEEAKQIFSVAKNNKWREIEAKAEEAENEEEEKAAWAEASVFQVPYLVSIGNILDGVSDMQSKGVLSVILKDTSAISMTESQLENRIQYREKVQGNMMFTKEVDWYRKMLVLTYLEQYFSNYVNPQNEHYLSYELEYALCGKASDWKNLEAALNRILLVREVANVTYLLQDREKMEEAETLARAVGLLIGENPAVVKVIQAGLIGAWAYAESILDVRALVAGFEIPLIKKQSEWTTEMKHVLTVFHSDMVARKCDKGLDYVEYIKQLLYFVPDSMLAYRMMEAMEMTLGEIPDYKNCKMDHMLVAMRYQLEFEAEPVFFSLMTIGGGYDGKLYFKRETERCYIP